MEGCHAALTRAGPCPPQWDCVAPTFPGPGFRPFHRWEAEAGSRVDTAQGHSDPACPPQMPPVILDVAIGFYFPAGKRGLFCSVKCSLQ